MESVKRSNLFYMILFVIRIVFVFGCSILIFYKAIDLSNIQLTVIGELVGVLLPCFIYLLLTKQSPKKVFSLNKLNLGDAGIIILIYLCLIPTMSVLNAITNIFSNNDIADLLKEVNSLPLYIQILYLAVVPAVCEEISMRGVVYSGYKNVSIRKAAIMNGLFFSLLHLNLNQSLYAFAIGVVLVYIISYTGSIFGTMLFHLCVNGVSTLLSWVAFKYIYSNPILKSRVIETQTTNDYTTQIVSIVFLIVLAILLGIIAILLLRKLKERNRDRIRAISIEESRENTKVMTWHAYACIGLYVFVLFIFPQIMKLIIK